ncbi:MAG: NUDIX hydrolase [Bacteroidales bacterium]|jgi:ADP-ribose pyrophosphatase YjhB (NUDIX family)|nr:NUDIX hydrolase [Bacteroidales bacterium]
MKEKWLQWVTQLQSIAQAGLTFAENQYDTDRYQQISDLTADILHNYTEVSYEKIKDLFTNETGYQTPKVDVRAAVIKNKKILLVKEKVDGKWSMPGGWADVNSTVRESAVRECFEEAGATVNTRRVIAIHLASKHNGPLSPYTIYKIFVECELIEKSFKENTETFSSGFFSLSDLPELSIERTTRKQIELCFEAKKHKLFETIFD